MSSAFRSPSINNRKRSWLRTLATVWLAGLALASSELAAQGDGGTRSSEGVATIPVQTLGTESEPKPGATPGERGVTLETVTVTANRTEQRPLASSASATPLITRELERAGIESVKEASLLTPNANVIEFSARAISNPQFRGVGGSPTNPGVTTYIDGVPQLNGDTSSQELLDLERIELVRGAQGTLYGRNTLGGVINVASRLPSLRRVRLGTGEVEVGDYEKRDVRFAVDGPLLAGTLGGALAAGYAAREGYSLNEVTNQRLDGRNARFGKAQLLWRPGGGASRGEGSGARAGSDGEAGRAGGDATPSTDGGSRGASGSNPLGWQLRALVSVENADDGDFPLFDLDMLRARPRRVRHDFTGFTRRDLAAQTLQVRYGAPAFSLESISGNGRYEAFETTDLDTGDQEQLTRRNGRRGRQLTQELRAALAKPLTLTANFSLSGQAGVFGFVQDNDQAVVNVIPLDFLVANANSFGLPAPLPQPVLDVVAPLVGVVGSPPAEDRTDARLDDRGLGVYAEGSLGVRRWTLTVGARYDVERKAARIRSGTVLPTALGELPLSQSPDVDAERRFTAFTPKAVLAYGDSKRWRAYASAAAGYRAGGFNPQSPVGFESYDEERSASYEVGVKARGFGGRLQGSAAVFLIDLHDLQLNQPIVGGGGRFFIDNAGRARNRGVEVEGAYALARGVSLFAALGTLDARFRPGSTVMATDGSGGTQDVGGNRIPFADRVSGALGVQASRPLVGALRYQVRAEVVQAGDYFYDASNGPRQEGYQLVNLRVGVGERAWQLTAGVRNLFDVATIPLAIPYTGLVPSGYVGESGAPRTVGVQLRVNL